MKTIVRSVRGMISGCLSAIFLFSVSHVSFAQQVSCFAGGTTTGNSGGNASCDRAGFSTPSNTTFGSDGTMYVADKGSHSIRKIATDGTVSTLAGSGTAGNVDGTGSAASFNSPTDVAVDASGNVYVADYGNNKIRKITPAGVVTTLAGSGTAGNADGTGTAATFKTPYGITIDAAGNLYVTDNGNHRIRKITPAGVVTHYAGSTNGNYADEGTYPGFHYPTGIETAPNGGVYVADTYNQKIKYAGLNYVYKISGTGSIGNDLGNEGNESFNYPMGIVYTSNGLYITERGGHMIKVVQLACCGSSYASVYHRAGLNQGYQDGQGTLASFSSPAGISVNAAGEFFICEQGSNVIRKMTSNNVVSYYAGGGTAFANGYAGLSSFNGPAYMTSDSYGNIYVSDRSNHCIKKISPQGLVTILAGSGTSGTFDGTGTSARFNLPCGLAVDASGNVYVADAGNNKIRKITSAGVVSTIATGFDAPTDLVVDDDGNLYVTDMNNHCIRKITPDGTISRYAGSGSAGFANGAGTVAKFHYPKGIARDKDNNLYITDSYNCKVRKISPTGVVSTLSGTICGDLDGDASTARLGGVEGIVIDRAGNLYVADRTRYKIKKITPDGQCITLCGSTQGSMDGIGTAARFYNPWGIAADMTTGNLYVTDQNRIKVVTNTGVVTGVWNTQAESDPNAMVYPNPAKDFLTIHSDLNGTCVIINSMGEVISEQVFDGQPVDVSALQSGIYFVKLISEKGYTVRKFVKE